MKPAGSRQKGARLERDVAAVMGGKRTPMSGAIGGAMAADVSFDSDSIYSPLHVECKSRAAIPGYVTAAYAQARVAAPALKTPAVVIKQDRGEPFIFMALDEFVTFTQALAETGQGSRIKSLARDARRLIEEIERSA